MKAGLLKEVDLFLCHFFDLLIWFFERSTCCL